MNDIVLVGEIADISKKAGKYLSGEITLAVKRPFKESDGTYYYDKIPVTIWRGGVETIIEHYKIGDTIGIRGRLEDSPEGLKVITESLNFFRV